jgi:hypothetical protein
MPATPEIDWYERRHELEPGQVFRSVYGIIKLDRGVPGDGTKWYAAEWYNGWAYYDATIEPCDLIERLPDNYGEAA